MSLEGRARVRWIRILVVVLGLTASRHNFPLHHDTWHSWAKTASTLGKAKPTSKKSEGVTPSRRSLESRRTDRLQARNSDPGPATFGLPPAGADVAAFRARPPAPFSSTSNFAAAPDQLRQYLRRSHLTSVPPPA